MKSYLWVASLALVAFVILVASARADDERGTLVRFKGGIGVIPVSSGVGTASHRYDCEPEHRPYHPTPPVSSG